MSLHWGPWLSPGTWGCHLPSLSAQSLCLQTVLCPTRPGPAENSDDTRKGTQHLLVAQGPRSTIAQQSGSKPRVASRVRGDPLCSVARPRTVHARAGQPETGWGPEARFARQAGRTLELPPRDARSQPGACFRALLLCVPFLRAVSTSPSMLAQGPPPRKLSSLAPWWQQAQCVWQSALCGP